MSYVKPTICAVLLVITISSTAVAGNIAPSLSGNIAPSRSGNIAPSRSGNIAVQPADARGRFDFSSPITSLFQLLLESGMLF